MSRLGFEAGQKVALVTGASQGIGAGLVEAFLEQGYRVVANSRTIEPYVSAELLKIAGDIADGETADHIVEGAIRHFGRLDTLVNNAGIFLSKAFVDYSPAECDAILATNLRGFFNVSQRAAKAMLRQGDGHIVTITATLADQPMPAALAALSKGGLNAVTRSLAIEFASAGIRVNAVSPGIIKTPMHRPETHEFLATLHPLRRMGTVSEIVDAVLYLETAAFVTGEVLHVDGGQHAGHW